MSEQTQESLPSVYGIDQELDTNPTLSLASVMEVFEAYNQTSRFLDNYGYVEYVYKKGQPSHMDDAQWQDWTAKNPRLSPEQMQEFNETRLAHRDAVFAIVPMPDAAQQDRLLLACESLTVKPLFGNVPSDIKNPAHVKTQGMGVYFEDDWYEILDGLITLAQLTGETFELHTGDHYNDYCTVTAQTPRQEVRKRYDPEHYPELREINNDLDIYARYFYPDQYEAKDPALLEKYQGIIDRLAASQKQPVATVMVCDDSIRFDMGLVNGSTLDDVKFGGQAKNLIGDICIKPFATQWLFTDLADPEKIIPYLSNARAVYREGLLCIEKLWQENGRLTRKHHDDIILLIGNREIEDYISVHPQHAHALDTLRHTYTTPELINMEVAMLPQPDSPLLYVDADTRARMINRHEQQ